MTSIHEFEGGSIVTGGVSLEGNFFTPTIIGDLTSDSELFRNEIFGPVAPIFAFEVMPNFKIQS